MRQYNTALRQMAVRRDDSNSTGNSVPQCAGWGTDLGDKGLRIASVFIILVGSLLGVFLPIALARTSPNWRGSKLAFFVCKYFGSGVILATAFMHLLSPAVEALSDPCLANMLPNYDWGHVICLMTIMIMFYIELMAARFNFSFGHSHGAPSALPKDIHSHESHSHDTAAASMPRRKPSHGSALSGREVFHNNNDLTTNSSATATRSNLHLHDVEMAAGGSPSIGSLSQSKSESSGGAVSAIAAGVPKLHQLPVEGGLPNHLSYPPGNQDHLAHDRDHVEGDSHASYGSQIVSLLILEFGVVFHSLFIGLSLAGSDNLRILLIVIAFHQFFEGLGLGSRLAVAQWPSNWKAWTGYLMAVGYGITTPIGIAIGLGINASLNSKPALSQLVNGVFDAVSSGILIYTALVELLAHEFMFNPEMRDAKLSVQMFAFGCVAVGVAIMSVLAKWA